MNFSGAGAFAKCVDGVFNKGPAFMSGQHRWNHGEMRDLVEMLHVDPLKKLDLIGLVGFVIFTRPGNLNSMRHGGQFLVSVPLSITKGAVPITSN